MSDSKKITKEILDLVQMNIPVGNNRLLSDVLDRVNKHQELKTFWKITNVNAIDRLGFSDHGAIHFQIVANCALKISRIFKKKGVEFAIVKDFGLTYEHAEVVIFLASIMHDLGMSIHRVGHETFSLFLTDRILNDILDFMPVEERTVVKSETLHAIISHSHGSAGVTSTIEGGIVRIADSLDMTKGRTRVVYGKSRISIEIHNVSHDAIDKVSIKEGDKEPINIEITMSNPAGIFQIDDFVKDKLGPSRLEKYIDVKAYILENGEKKLFKEYTS